MATYVKGGAIAMDVIEMYFILCFNLKGTLNIAFE